MRPVVWIIVAAILCAPFFAPLDPAAQDRLHPYAEPGATHPLGTDEYGRDQLSRLLYGGRVSLAAGVFATVLTLGLGLVLGGAAGYLGGVADEVIMRMAELFLCVPWLYLLLGVRAFLPLTVRPVESFFLIVAIIGLVGWARPARLIRAVVLSGRELPYVLAARGFGAGHLYLFRRHLLPLVWTVLRTQAQLLAPRFILAEVSLSFLGLGVGEPAPSWGQTLAVFRHVGVMEVHPWVVLPPIIVVIVIFTLLRASDTLKQL